MARISIEDMTLEEKLDTMEAIWEDLCRRAEVPVFKWHEQVLKQREDAVVRGEDSFEDLEYAKVWIRKQIE